MRIAIVMPHSIEGTPSGDRARTSLLANGLRQRGHLVDIIAPSWSLETAPFAVNETESEVLLGQRGTRIGWLFRRLALSFTRTFDRNAIHHSPRVARSISGYIDSSSYDIVDLQHSFWSLQTNTPLVVTVHNVLANPRLDGGGLLRRIVRTAHERKSLRKADEVVVLSKEERSRCELAHPCSIHKIHEVPIGYPATQDLARWREVAMQTTVSVRDAAEQVTFLFVGSMDYAPNRDTAVELIKVWERIPAIRDHLRLLIAGRMADRVGPVTDPRVEVVPDPVDLMPLYARSTAALMPLKHGGGVRLKALEAMAYGVPIIGSSLAVDGLGLEHGKSFLRVENTAELLKLIMNLETSILPRLSKNAHEQWQQIGNPDLMIERMLSVYGDASQSRRLQREGGATNA